MANEDGFEERTCTICGDPVEARNLCSRHYAKWRRDTGPSRDVRCAVESCGRPVLAAALCSTHYQRKRRNGSEEGDRPIRDAGARVSCAISGCQKDAARRGWCHGHYSRWKAHGDPLAGRPPRAPAGTGTIDKNGYRVIRRNGRYVFEHRVKMELMLGRPLRRDENVHHLNGHRGDNRPENLELWSTSQPTGQRIDDKVKWAIEFLARYRPDVLDPAHRGHT